TVAEAGLVVESAARDPRDGSLLVGSLARGGVWRVGPGGALARLDHPADSLGETLGMHVSADGARLWVATGAPRPAVVALSLADGRVTRRLVPPADGGPHLPNDLVLVGDSLFVTDSHAGAVYVAALAGPAADTLRPVPARDPQGNALRLAYPNGIATLDGGRTLHVATSRGLVRLERGSGHAARVTPAPRATLAMIDGLYAHGGRLVAVQNGVGLSQVVSIALDAGGARAIDVRVLERFHPAHDTPTTGVVVGDTLVYVANSQVSSLDAAGRLRAGVPPQRAVLLALPLR
ncbi:hypothetical protein PYV61_25770, partial [Roseisolibacter sp. H3M3-2]